MSIRVGFIGLGRMGMPMAANLLAAGFPIVAFDIDEAKCKDIRQRGATIAASPGDAASRSDISLSIVMNDAILQAVACGADGVFAQAKPGHLFVDLSTVSPQASAEVSGEARKRGIRYLCARVAGSVGLAQDGTLSLFASGARADFEACAPLFEPISAKAHYVGEGDAAAYLKLVHSLIVGVYSSMIGEALAFGERGGLDLSTMVDILEAGPLGSRQLTLKSPVLRERRFENPPSDIDTAAKDLDLILDTARRNGMPLPLTASVRQVMAVAQAHGRGKRDIYSILETCEEMANLPTISPAPPSRPE